MELSTQKTNYKRLYLLVLGTVILANLCVRLLVSSGHFGFSDGGWREAINGLIVILFAVPVLVYLERRNSQTTLRLHQQMEENSAIYQKLVHSNKELEYNATHDYLTELPNRYKLFETLNTLTEKNSELAVLFIDLDRFKLINDTMGHLSGDQFIKLVSIRVKETLPEGAQLFRHGGDEFVIVSELQNRKALEIASALLKAFKDPFEVNDTILYTSASIGISLLPQHGTDAATLVKNADRAMYRAKEQGGSMYRLFSQSAEDADQKQQLLEKDLRHALETEELVIHYQPVIDLKTDELRSFEALVRWKHPEFGIVPPAEFIPVAERSDLINDIGTWVLENACRQVKGWHAVHPGLGIAVNVSIRQFRNMQFPGLVKDVLEITDFPAHLLTLEITESMMQDDTESFRVIEEIRALGVRIAIDDFGTGYSSLSKLGFLPIDYLKIDRSFTMEMLTHKPMQSIVQTIIAMGRNLDMLLIAEGIEESEQAAILKELGCQFGQGYLYSKPLDAEEIEWAYALSASPSQIV